MTSPQWRSAIESGFRSTSVVSIIFDHLVSHEAKLFQGPSHLKFYAISAVSRRFAREIFGLAGTRGHMLRGIKPTENEEDDPKTPLWHGKRTNYELVQQSDLVHE
jgi:hypothetical protein